MKFFHGFMFKNEQDFFKNHLKSSEYNVAGFSYGAIKAFEYVLNSNKRVDSLQLFSPAFFQTEKLSFLKTQLIYFQKDKKSYQNIFFKNVIYPNKSINIDKFKTNGTLEELKELLNYKWEQSKIQTLLNRNIRITVFLGSEDKIIDSQKSLNFFRESVEVCLIKSVGHLLI